MIDVSEVTGCINDYLLLLVLYIYIYIYIKEHSDDQSNGSKASNTKSFFTQCIIKLWSSLPQEAVEAKVINGLKNPLDKCMKGSSINGY